MCGYGNIATQFKQNGAITMYGKEFSEMQIGKCFHFNGNDYEKRSTRTARMLCNGRTFYIGKSDIVYPIQW